MLLLLACTASTPPGNRSGPGGGPDDSEPRESRDDSKVDSKVDSPAPEGGELRGIWVTRWSYSSASDIETIMTEVADAGFNAVFFQVRGNFDAYYDSKVEPWASRLSGTLGKNPGWDPLAEAVTRGHAHGLQVHAYINTFPYWSGTTPPDSAGIEHAYEAHPDWTVADTSGKAMALNSSYIFASPGNPDVRAHIASVAKDIADRYDVDGIHLDYVRYPGSQYSHDPASEAAFSGSSLSWADFEREQVKLTVKGVSDAVDVPVTAAVWGVYENKWGWSSVSQGNIDYYQDSHGMLQEGLLDATLPMIYWPVTATEGERLDFLTLAKDHVANAGDRHVYAGMSSEDLDAAQLIACVEAARAAGAQGVVLFDYSTGKGYFDELKAGPFAEPASPPAMPWRK